MNNTYNPSLSPKDATRAITKLGKDKSNTRVWQLLILGVLAGLYIGFGGQFFLAAMAGGMGKVVGGLAFSVGLILVVIAGAELFTGNMVIVIGVLAAVIPKRSMLKNWATVYAGNLIGSVAFAWLMYQTGLFGRVGDLNATGTVAAAIADAKMALPFGEAFVRGVFCNILVILAIIMAVMAKDIASKILVIILPIACFVACGYEHCVANMYLICVGLLAKGVPFFETFVMFENLLPVTLGNIVGGVFILIIHPRRIRQIRVLFQKSNRKKG